jgi:hypothetical protein
MTYIGSRTRTGCVVHVMPEGKRLPLRLDLANHSPTGFEWGYGGSGPAQLALALCAHVLEDDVRALRIHQRFKFRTVGGLPPNYWILTRSQILATIEELEAARATRDA